jgi:hypothetical protein
MDAIYWVNSLFDSGGTFNLFYKRLVTYQVTNDHGLYCLHKLNISNVQTRLVNVRTTQKRLHNSYRTTLNKR